MSTTPPEITTGSFVSWDGGQGRVDLVVTSGTVPGVSGDVEGSTKTPAARVVVWKDGKATGEKIGASTHTLKRIAPLDGNDESKSLVGMLTSHQRQVHEGALPRSARLTGQGLKTAYERGLDAWPGANETGLTPQEWALGRAAHLCKAAAEPETLTNDTDLLDPTNPLFEAAADPRPEVTPTRKPLDPRVDFLDGTQPGDVFRVDPTRDLGDEVEIDQGDVEAILAALEATANGEGSDTV